MAPLRKTFSRAGHNRDACPPLAPERAAKVGRSSASGWRGPSSQIFTRSASKNTLAAAVIAGPLSYGVAVWAQGEDAGSGSTDGAGVSAGGVGGAIGGTMGGGIGSALGGPGGGVAGAAVGNAAAAAANAGGDRHRATLGRAEPRSIPSSPPVCASHSFPAWSYRMRPRKEA
jgi:hypothetical protein